MSESPTSSTPSSTTSSTTSSTPSATPAPAPVPRRSRFVMLTHCQYTKRCHPAGRYPVALGDVLADRYRVLRKLGFSSSSTVWLVEDTSENGSAYVALKIYVAGRDTSHEMDVAGHLATRAPADPDANFVLLPSYTFELDGPGGRHLCLAYRPMGRSLGTYLLELPPFGFSSDPSKQRPLPTPLIRRLVRNALCGLRFLHRHGVVHGNLFQGKVRMAVRDLAEFGSSLRPVQGRDGDPDCSTPNCLWCAAPLRGDFALPSDEQVLTVTDLCEAFFVDAPPPAASIRISQTCRAPELILQHDRAVGPPLDIWALATIVFVLLTNEQPLFDVTFVDDDDVDDSHLVQLTETLGPLPDDLLALWTRRGLHVGPDGERTRQLEDDPTRRCRTLEERFAKFKPRDVDDAEAAQILALLREMLELDPAKRATADELLSRPWFQV